MVEYMMLLAFVAVIGIIGVRAVGPAAAGMFDGITGGFEPATAEAAPTEVLGVTLNRPTRFSTSASGCPQPGAVLRLAATDPC